METVAPIEDLAQVATRWQDTMLSLEKEYEQEPEVLKIGGVPIGTLGNFSASIIRKSKFPQNPKRSVRFSGKRTKRSVQKRKARNTQKAETKVL